MRKWIKAAVALGVILLALLASEAALAHRGHHSHLRFGLFVGVPIGWHYWHYPPPYYYYPTVVTVPASPPVYIERAPQAPEPQSYWYFCAGSNAYYPYVRQCPGGWQRVAPQPQD